MRTLPRLFLIALLGCSAALAQQPPRLEPLPEPPPLPPGVINEAPGDQPVTINPGPNDRIEEFLVEGKRTVKVTQPGGKVYYLQEQEIGATTTADGLVPRVRAPLWVIREF